MRVINFTFFILVGTLSSDHRWPASSRFLANALQPRYDLTRAAAKGITSMPHLWRPWFPSPLPDRPIGLGQNLGQGHLGQKSPNRRATQKQLQQLVR